MSSHNAQSSPAASNPGQAPYELAEQAAAALLQKTGFSAFDAAIVLGSGWRPAADVVCEAADSDVQEFPMSDLPGFLPPTAEGHGGTIRALRIGERNVLILLGRTHAYEGHELWRCAHAVRTAAAAGVKQVVLTNAAGGLTEGMSVGEPVLISDHINFTAKTPLVGANFVNLVDAYSPELREKVKALRPGIREAVYAMMPGPQYETPAEIHMLRTFGVGLVGMSTVYETIAAREAGVDVLGISLVTNLAAGVTGEALNHEEVLAAGQAAAQEMGSLLASVIQS
ncbi:MULTISPECIES: purine-nucleoside phosphorylase [Corynebacterium]|uniref:Purine nucleoside phosphorylase n=1 Tax=Corynebacterium urealyticum TaxID=43771 RepID=A0A5D4FKL9_9CORY|nr:MULTISPECIES: purine-nucleoside phosphorylase [Corynebacterium]MDK7134429.1 purine-nucleoside phosphorylase [Corynebacterium sp. UMB4614]TYR16986.1 purine-nucleoside phosphorylase [Corynebacterium urealyticum]WOH94815.1 purine-nucleoside phosphorylase [Corynebacterium urealyticum]